MNAPAEETAGGTPVLHHAELPSTNVEAMRLAAAGEAGPLWVSADAQTAGKGRSGRQWLGASGNLYASYLFTTAAPIASAHQLSLVAGVAVHEAILVFAADRVHGLRLKWPNDILLATAKIGGILVESTSLPGRGGLSAVIGIGLNLAAHPEIPGRDVTSLSAHGCSVTPPQALKALDRTLRQALAMWDAARGFAAIRAAWLERAGRVGERISVQAAAGPLSGTFAGIDEDGALLVALDDGARHRCTYGDVTLE